MKKLALICFVALLGIMFTVPTYALENQFGGYWRTRFYNQTNFDGDDDVRVGEIQRADTRTRLYYTAVLNDNLKFVNKFEFDATWGSGTYGEIGADGKDVEIKNSYIDFNWMDANFKIGTQPAVIHRAFLFDDDFTGATMSAGGLTAVFQKHAENSDASGDDVSAYMVKYAIGMDGLTITPTLTYGDYADEDYVYFLGLDIDGAAGGLSYWGTFIYEGGEFETTDVDVSAFLVAAGLSMDLSEAMGLHFEAFYATGDDDAGDDDLEAFTAIPGQAYYWSEIMGLGMFDNQVSNGSPGGNVSNILAANVGINVKVSEKLSLGADLWYALLAEDDAAGEDELGTEIDVTAKYMVIEGLTLDIVGAYLMAGDATGDDDPFEVGARLSISF